jgi:hypothetical protein
MTACIEAHPSSSKAVFRNDGYDFAKLAACFFMAINHLTLHLGKVPALQGFLVSRMVMPIFAFILVSRLMGNFDGRNLRLQRNLLFWGIISQVPYAYFNRVNHFTTDILLDLWAGVVLIALSRKFGFRARVPLIVPGLLLTVTFNSYFGYTAALPIGMLIASWFVPRSKALAAAIILIAAVLANNLFLLKPAVEIPAALCLLLAIPLLILSQEVKNYVPRLPKMFFYTFYPATYVIANLIDLARITMK